MTARRVLGVVAFALGLVLCDQAGGRVLDAIFARVGTGEFAGRPNRSLRHTEAEIVVFGSSRAVYHIDPEVLSSSLHRAAYNAGSAGRGIGYARALESLLLRRGSRAKVFVLVVDMDELWSRHAARVSVLAPFWGESEVLDEMLEARTPLARWKLRSGVYRYNSMILPVVANWLFESEADVGGGFVRMKAGRKLDPSIRPTPRRIPGPVNGYQVELFRGFIRDAREHGVDVILITAPRWRPDGLAPMERAGRPRIAAIARQEGALYAPIDHLTHPEFVDPTLFADETHLTPEGAALYSRQLAAVIADVLADRDD